MKKLNYLITISFFAILAVSCSEKDRTFPEFAEIEHGAIARLLGKVDGKYAGNFSPSDADNSNAAFEVEFYDDNQGKNVASYVWNVTHSKSAKTAELLKVTSDKFVVNANGLPGTKINITLPQVLSALGMTLADIKTGEKFNFAGTIILTDGRKITSNNSAAALELPAFANFLRFSSSIQCPPYVEGDYGGEYTVLVDNWVDYALNSTILVTKVSANTYSFNYNCGATAKPILMKIDPATGRISGDKAEYCSYDLPPLTKFLGDIVEGATSYFNTCDKAFFVKIDHTDEKGAAYGAYDILLQKK